MDTSTRGRNHGFWPARPRTPRASMRGFEEIRVDRSDARTLALAVRSPAAPQAASDRRGSRGRIDRPAFERNMPSALRLSTRPVLGHSTAVRSAVLCKNGARPPTAVVSSRRTGVRLVVREFFNALRGMPAIGAPRGLAPPRHRAMPGASEKRQVADGRNLPYALFTHPYGQNVPKLPSR